MLRRGSATLLAVALAMPAAAEKISLDAISDYLNGLRTGEAEFTQINDDGSISTGMLYIHRPGRMRFEYDPPEATLVLASGNAVAIFDPKGDSGPETYPLERTPLKLILARDVDLGRDNMVVDHSEDGAATTVTAQDPENPEYGTIQMAFTGPPVELRQWRVNDDSGASTTVVLGEMKTGGSYAPSLFSIQANSLRRESPR
ncbi:MAG: LolA family protein [Paracoccaceae bacterium]